MEKNKYNNIRTCCEHYKAKITFQTLKKNLGKSVAIVGIPLVAFTACSGEVEEKKELGIIDISISETLQGKKENKLSIQYNEIEENSNIKKIIFKNSREKNTKQLYNELKQELKDELEKKDFGPIANEFFIEIFEKLYENYPKWKELYKDLPSTQQYIRKNLIDTINKISNVNMYEFDSEQAKKLKEAGYARYFSDSEYEITIIYTDLQKASKEEHENDLENMFHEMIHIEYMGKGEDEPTFGMKFVNEPRLEQKGEWIVSDSAGEKFVEYRKDTTYGYLVNLNTYENLVCFAGYKTLIDLNEGICGFSGVENQISLMYGEELAKSITKSIEIWYKLYNESWESDEIYNESIKLQKLYLECIKQDIEKLDISNKDEVYSYINIYRNYKMKNMCHVIDENGNECTNDIFEIDLIDKKLVEKISQSNIINVSENEKLNKMVINALLYTNADEFDENLPQSYIPVLLSEFDCLYYEENNRAYIEYKKNNDSIRINFNEEKILGVQFGNDIITQNKIDER